MLSFLRKKPDYQNTLNWANAPKETILLTWDIKLIAHDWITPTIYFTAFVGGFIMAPIICAVYLFAPDGKVAGTWLLVTGVLFFAAFILLQVRVKNQFVYRLSDLGIEYHRWRVYPEFLFSGVKGTLVAIGVLAILVGIFSKQGFFIIAGPVSIAIGAFVRIGTSDYKKWAVNYVESSAFWRSITRMQYDPKKRLVRLDYHFDISQEEIDRVLAVTGSVGVRTEGEYDIFLSKENEQQALSILQYQLPNIPLEITKLKLPEVV